jgi:signal transduction histidine kinase
LKRFPTVREFRRQLLQKLSLSKKILLGILPLFVLFVAVSVILQNHFQEQEMLEEAQASAITYANIMKESMVSMMVSNLEVDRGFLQRLNNLQPLDTVHIVRNDLHLRPEVLTPERRKREEMISRAPIIPDAMEIEALNGGKPAFRSKGDRFRAVIPFNATDVCQKCHAVPIGYSLGAADIHVSFTRVSAAAESNWKRSSLIFLGFSVIVVTVASILFRRFVRTPIDRLVRATREIGSGQMDNRIPDTLRGEDSSSIGSPTLDEVRFLALKFDQMRISLKDKIAEIDDANRNLSVRNSELEEALKRLRHAQEDLVRSERRAATGWMTAQLSHEINNPIHNIQSLLESSLRKLPDGTGVRELITVALEEVTRMATLTQQMLAYFRGSVMEGGEEPVDMGNLLRELVMANKAQFSMQQIELRHELCGNLQPVRGLREKLKQAFSNILTNAADAITPPGKITIKAEQNTDHLRIRIADTGSGIPVENLGKIFDPFFTTKEEVSGVGLGLFVSYRIIQYHGGTIQVASSVGDGTTFTIELPTKSVHHE